MNQCEIIAYFDRCAPEWDARQVRDNQKIDWILDTAGIQHGVRVLDVACGTGVLFGDYLARGVDWVTGVDIAPGMAKIAASKFHDPRIEVLCGDVETLPLAPRYDCCVVYNAFPHFENPGRLIRRLTSLLLPGGRLTIAHGMSLEALQRHHAGSAASVSRPMLTVEELGLLMTPGLQVDAGVSDAEKYLVSGRRLETLNK